MPIEDVGVSCHQMRLRVGNAIARRTPLPFPYGSPSYALQSPVLFTSLVFPTLHTLMLQEVLAAQEQTASAVSSAWCVNPID